MRKLFKWLGVILGILVGILLLAVAALYFITEDRIDKVYAIEVKAIPIPENNAQIDRGRHLVNALGLCSECHGENLAGQVFDEGPLVGRLVVSNLTSGEGGIGSQYSDTDWVRALRHGVGPDGKSLLYMPSSEINFLSDADLGAVIAYLKSVPPVANQQQEMMIGLMGRLFLLQEPSLLPAQVIDHNAPRGSAPEPSLTAEYGAYLVNACKPCHGQSLSGSQEVGAGSNLTPGGRIAAWSFDEFLQTLRTGVNPLGEQLDPMLMPWKKIGQLTDEEIKAIWIYLQSLPPLPMGASDEQD